MKRLLLVLAMAAASACSRGDRPRLPIGSAAPDFALPGVDGRTHSLGDYVKNPVLAVVFTGNSCPASQLYESRIRKLADDYRDKGVAVVAINPNKHSAMQLADLRYTDVGESLEDMKVRAAHRQLRHPYLSDGDTQSVSRAFGVAAMPHIFVFDRTRRLQYEGRIDDNAQEEKVTAHDARNAIDALLSNRSVPVTHTRVTGCEVNDGTASAGSDPDLSSFQKAPVTVEMIGAEDLAKLRRNGTGKLLLINFWATWCAPCASEFPDLEATYRRYHPRNLEFVSVSVNDPAERPAVLSFLQSHHASHPNRLFATSDVYGLQAAFDPKMPAPVPFTLLLAPNGDVLYQELGELTVPKLRRAILANLPDDEKYPGLQAYWSNPD